MLLQFLPSVNNNFPLHFNIALESGLLNPNTVFQYLTTLSSEEIVQNYNGFNVIDAYLGHLALHYEDKNIPESYQEYNDDLKIIIDEQTKQEHFKNIEYLYHKVKNIIDIENTQFFELSVLTGNLELIRLLSVDFPEYVKQKSICFSQEYSYTEDMSLLSYSVFKNGNNILKFLIQNDNKIIFNELDHKNNLNSLHFLNNIELFELFIKKDLIEWNNPLNKNLLHHLYKKINPFEYNQLVKIIDKYANNEDTAYLKLFSASTEKNIVNLKNKLPIFHENKNIAMDGVSLLGHACLFNLSNFFEPESTNNSKNIALILDNEPNIYYESVTGCKDIDLSIISNSHLSKHSYKTGLHEKLKLSIINQLLKPNGLILNEKDISFREMIKSPEMQSYSQKAHTLITSFDNSVQKLLDSNKYKKETIWSVLKNYDSIWGEHNFDRRGTNNSYLISAKYLQETPVFLGFNPLLNVYEKALSLLADNIENKDINIIDKTTVSYATEWLNHSTAMDMIENACKNNASDINQTICLKTITNLLYIYSYFIHEYQLYDSYHFQSGIRNIIMKTEKNLPSLLNIQDKNEIKPMNEKLEYIHNVLKEEQITSPALQALLEKITFEQIFDKQIISNQHKKRI